MCVSLLGDGIFVVAMAWQVYALSNAPTALALVGITMTVPTIALLLLGGVRQRPLRPPAHHGRRRRRARARRRAPGAALADRRPRAVAHRGARGVLRRGHGVLQPVLRRARARGPARRRPRAGQRAGPVRAADRAAPGGAGAGRRAHRASSARAPPSRVDAASFVVSAVALLAMAPGVRAPAAEAAGTRHGRHRAWACATSAATCGCGRRSPAPRSPTCSSWARPRCCCPSSSRTTCTASAADLGIVFAAGGIGSVGCAVVLGQRGLPRRDITFMYVDVDAGHAGRRGLRPGHRGVAAHARQPGLQRPGDGRHDRVGDGQAAPRPGRAARPRLEPRLAHLDRPAAAVLRAHRAGERRHRRADDADRGRRAGRRGHLRGPAAAGHARRRGGADRVRRAAPARSWPVYHARPSALLPMRCPHDGSSRSSSSRCSRSAPAHVAAAARASATTAPRTARRRAAI